MLYKKLSNQDKTDCKKTNKSLACSYYYDISVVIASAINS